MRFHPKLRALSAPSLLRLLTFGFLLGVASGAELWPLRKQTWRLSPDPVENTRLVRAAAERGDPLYQYHYAKMLQEGRGVPQDMATAEKWFIAAAEQGNANAQFHAGIHLERGLNGPRKGPEGLAWFEKAAAQGHPRAITSAAVVNSLGATVPKDPAKAFYWYLKSAERGNVQAAYSVGRHYRDGEGVVPDPTKAREWMRKAADAGDGLAQATYAKMLAESPGATVADLTESIAWLRKSAASGDDMGLYELALLYAEGRGVPRDGAKALQYLHSTSRSFKFFAYYPIGLIYLEGNGVPKDELEGAAWLQLAARENTEFTAKARVLLETHPLKVSKAAVEKRAAQILETIRLEASTLFKKPAELKDWQQVDVSQACTFYLPPTFQIHAQHIKDGAYGLTVADCDAVVAIVPRNGTDRPRIEIRTEVGAGLDYPDPRDTITFAPAELVELETGLRQEVAATGAASQKITILATEPAKVVTLKERNRAALLIACRRRVGEGKTELVQQYRIPNFDRMHIITFITDEDLSAARRAELEKMLATFRVRS